MRLKTAVVGACLVPLMVAAPSAHAAFPGTNGKIVIDHFDALGSGSRDVYIYDPNGPDGPITSEDDSDWPDAPRVSPDGGKVVWTCNYHDVCTMNIDGTANTKIHVGHFPPVAASYSPDGTKIVFNCDEAPLCVMNPDGSGITPLGTIDSAHNPAWSPDGLKIAFDAGPQANSDIYVMNADGTGEHPIATGPLREAEPSWSPDGTRIAFTRDAPGGGSDIYSIRPDGTGEAPLATSPDKDLRPAWSPDGTKIAFASDRDHISDPFSFRYLFELYVMNSDGTGQTRLTFQDPEYAAEDFIPWDWQPLPINSYPRPRGATPLRVPLLPANKPCTAPNTTHGAPLSYGSCGPPQLTSGQLTTGTPDSNGLPVRMDASLLLRVVVGNPSTPADEADVRIDAHLNDVFEKDLSDYPGALRAALPLRITDKLNTPSPGGPRAATTQPFQYGFDIPCTPDPAPTLGSDCALSTTADSLVPGTVTESVRTIWQVGRVRVDDAGPDGDPDTTDDNTVFAVQGVFVP